MKKSGNYAFWKASGLCTKCGAKASQNNKSLCEDCRQERVEYYRRRADVMKQRARESYWKNPERAKRLHTERCRKDKKACIERYGGRCACCGVSEWEFLTLDHGNGDGAEHRALVKAGGTGFYPVLRRQGFPDVPGLRVLCMNCHMARHWFGYCPHGNL